MRIGSHQPAAGAGLYDRIYELVDQIPPGQVATYGQLAELVGRCTPRMVGYAMAATPTWRKIPWQRVINSQGRVSPRRHSAGHLDQRQLLETEGIVFDSRERIDLDRFGWRGPQKPRQPGK